jgi:hypothetical protein
MPTPAILWPYPKNVTRYPLFQKEIREITDEIRKYKNARNDDEERLYKRLNEPSET